MSEALKHFTDESGPDAPAAPDAPGDTFFRPLGAVEVADSARNAGLIGKVDAGHLVRELVQNADDSRRPDADRVHVRVREVTLGRDDVLALLGPTGARHWRAAGYDVDAMLDGARRAIVVEDFGTKGLVGEPRTMNGRASAIASYFVSVGVSTKSAGEGGSHGVGGRCALLGSGRPSMFVGLTEREDGRAYMMGHAEIGSHTLDGVEYAKFGVFARDVVADRGGGQRGWYEPIEGEAARALARRLGVTRRRGEPGLSLVLPLPHDDLGTDDPDPGSGLRSAALANFFHQIAGGRISFDFEGEVVDASNVVEELSGHPLLAHLAPLARMSRDDAAGRLPTFHADPGDVRLDADAFPAADAAAMRELWERGDAFAVEASLRFRRRGDRGTRTGTVRALVRPSGTDGTASAAFVRAGCLLSDERARGASRTCAVVEVRPGPANDFFRSIEPAAHNRWNGRDVTRNGEYRGRDRERITDVRHLPGTVQRMCAPDDGSEEIATMFDRALSLPPTNVAREGPPVPDPNGPEGAGGAGRRRDGAAGRPADRGAGIGDSVRSFRPEGGVGISGNDGAAWMVGRRMLAEFAYPAPGDPFRKHRIRDFDLLGRNPDVPITEHVSGAEIVSRESNALVLEIRDPGFELTVTGFDPELPIECRCELTE